MCPIDDALLDAGLVSAPTSDTAKIDMTPALDFGGGHHFNDGITRSATVRIVPKIRRSGGPGQPVPQAASISRPMRASQRVPRVPRAPSPVRRGVKPAKR